MTKFFLKIKGFFKSDDSNKLEWILFGLIFIFLFSCFVYWDIFATTAHTVNFIETISRGKFIDFYKINYEFSVNGIVSTVCYDLPIYFILMLWNLPLWICQHFFSIDLFNNFFTILWMKGILVLFVVLCSWIIKKICVEININKKYIKWILLLFISSPLLCSSVFILSQTDIIPIFFILLGVLEYLRGSKKYLLWFAIAIPMKLISLFVFIPLLLLKEKKILKIIKNLLLVLLPLVGVKVIQSFMPMYAESTSGFNGAMMDKLINSSTININFGAASLFIAAYVGICIFCYMKNIKTKEELNCFTIYTSFVTYMIFLLFVTYHPYWIIYLVPFLTIVLFINPQNFKINMLLETIFCFVALFIQTNYYSWCFGAEQVKRMLPSLITSNKVIANLKFSDLQSIYKNFNLSEYIPAFLGIYLAITIALIIINYPKKNISDCKLEIERPLVWIRMLIIVLFALLMLLCYLI